MDNHYHLLIETPYANLKQVMQNINTSYTVYINRRHNRAGHLFQGRYKAFIVDKESYLLELGRYIHLNPVRAEIVKIPEDYKWSSYNFYAFGKNNDLLQPSVEYLGLSENKTGRQKLYRGFVMDGEKEKRGIERYFRQGFYGEPIFGKNLKSKGLVSKGWKKGPKMSG
jgi:hypothetical protein